MKKLLAGFARFRKEVFPQQEALFQRLKGEQNPVALFITCSDSRVVPSLFTSTDPGDIFLIRNAGNIVPAYGEVHGGVTATIEYAMMVLKVPHIVVCGHSDCGAVNAMLHPEKLTDMPSVSDWLRHAEVARRVVNAHYGKSSEKKRVEAMTYENILCQLEHLRTHPSVAVALSEGKVQLHGWVYDIAHGTIKAFDASKGHFVDLDHVDDVPHATPRARSLRYTEAD